MKEVRLLNANEIECRVGQCGKSMRGVAWCSLLLYKDARCDMKVMDETFGPLGWKKSYELINGNLFCTVSVRDEQGEWITRQDVGVESNTEKEKGQASDAFKRACVNFGIGRELYTSPKIFITLGQNEVVEKNGKPALSPKVVFSVAEIGYDENRCVNKLTIVDSTGVVRYSMGQDAGKNASQPASDSSDIEEMYAFAIPALKQANDKAACQRVWDDFPQLQSEQRFIDAINERLSQIAA